MKEFFNKSELKEIVKQHWLKENGLNEDDLDIILVKERPGGLEIVSLLKTKESIND